MDGVLLAEEVLDKLFDKMAPVYVRTYSLLETSVFLLHGHKLGKIRIRLLDIQGELGWIDLGSKLHFTLPTSETQVHRSGGEGETDYA